MASRATLTVNGKAIPASPGETLVDAALGGSILIPHDCRSGQCGCCRVTVTDGMVDAKGTQEGNTVLACCATLTQDAAISFEPLPVPVRVDGRISEITTLSPDMVQIVITTRTPLDVRPGQYTRVKFSGFPAREYSPTFRMDGSEKAVELVYQIRRIPGGVVSSEFGRAIRIGHKVSVQGPFGHAYLRSGNGPLVLVSGGAGWAPMWSVARAARRDQPGRAMIVIAGSRDIENLYMRPSLDWLRQSGATQVIATSEFGAAGEVLAGVPTAFLPELTAQHMVYVAGPMGLVNAVKQRALGVSAACYSDPFLASARGPSVLDRLTRTFNVFRRVERQTA